MIKGKLLNLSGNSFSSVKWILYHCKNNVNVIVLLYLIAMLNLTRFHICNI